VLPDEETMTAGPLLGVYATTDETTLLLVLVLRADDDAAVVALEV